MTQDTIYLTISHSVFLNRYQRYNIGEYVSTEVRTVGTSVPTWVCVRPSDDGKRMLTDEPSSEIVCEYVVTSRKQAESVVEMLDDGTGYQINLREDGLRQRLLDAEDGGKQTLMFKTKDSIKIGRKTYKVVHFVIIKDLATLNGSLTTSSE